MTAGKTLSEERGCGDDDIVVDGKEKYEIKNNVRPIEARRFLQVEEFWS